MDRLTLALFGVAMFLAGFLAASVYLWWALATGRRGIKLRDGVVVYPAKWWPEAGEAWTVGSDSLANDAEIQK